MRYMKLTRTQRDDLLAALAAMPGYLRTVFYGLSAEQARTPVPDGAFSPVEQVWHLADLEREGFAERIRRLMSEQEPQLADFDGTRIAAERDYRSLSLEEGLRAFAEARRRNIDSLPAQDSVLWFRRGLQEGVGDVSLCDMPDFMLQHDAAHKLEIEAWRTERA